MPNIHLRAKGAEEKKPEDICVFAQTNYRNQLRKFGIKTDDRRRHMYVIGKTGMGKTTMMENMVLNDIYKGHGVGIVDPHGDFAEKIIDFIPNNRINDVVYFNPADVEYPIGFNILEVNSEEQKHLVAAGLMGIFKKIWPDVWSSRMEYILNNTILALLDYPGSTLLGINRLLSDKDYRRKVVKQLKDPIVKAFWQVEFASYNDRYAQEAVAPIQNKIGQFLSASVIRNIVAQVKSTINVREIMDSGKILIMNLSKGRIGEDNSRLLGNMLITEIQLAAMERVDMPENERNDFFLYVDEFQNFATPSFANILSEARKYRLSLIMAHQYVAQLDELVSDAVFGNVGSIVTFRVGAADSEILAKEFAPTFIEQDIVNLSKFRVILKLMIDGVASDPFSAMTIPPIGSRTGSAEKVIRVSRERYAKHRDIIADKILRWSGMGGGDSSALDDDDDEDVDDIDTTLEDKTVEKNNKKIEDKVTEVVENFEEEKINNVLDVKKSEESKPNDEEIISFDKAPNTEKIANENNKEEKKELVIENIEDDLLPGLDYRIESKKIETKAAQPQKNEEPVDLLPGLIKNDNLSFSQNSVNNNVSLDTPKKKKRKRNRKKKSSNGLAQTNVVNNSESKSDSVQPKKIQADDIIKFD